VTTQQQGQVHGESGVSNSRSSALSPRGDLVDRIAALGDDHRDVIERLIAKAESGAVKYGELRLDSDPRDFSAELVLELLDAVHYATMDNVRLRRERAGLQALCSEQRRTIDKLRVELGLAELTAAEPQLPTPIYSCTFDTRREP
jgi:hypothetical protein